MSYPVIKGMSACLVHAPSMVRYGSKPLREVHEDGPWPLGSFLQSLRSYDEAVAYAPHQVFIGNMSPDELWNVDVPWSAHLLPKASPRGPFGEIFSERQFYGLLKLSDQFDLLALDEGFVAEVRESLAAHPLLQPGELDQLGSGVTREEIERRVAAGALPLWVDRDRLAGCMMRAHDQDESLTAQVLLENLACKASGAWALRSLLADGCTKPDEIDYIFGCGEEAVGDRYQRGGGAMGKVFGEMAGCLRATGSDLKAFCCSPVHAVILAAGLVQGGLFRRVAVVGGGSFAKLGMKFQGHLRNSMPILEDVLGALAVVVGEDDGINPQIRLDAIGKHDIGVDTRPQAVAETLVAGPLDRLGWRITEIGKYATEMHNPEITEPAGSGNVPRNNYRIIGSLAIARGEIPASGLDEFVRTHGMPGFSPTQGHIASAIAYLGHAWRAMQAGQMERALFMAKGSLFLGRMTHLSDGMSFILQGQH